MPHLCRVRYSILTWQSNLKAASPDPCTGEAEEWREPDEWGDPGELVRRKWIRIEDYAGRNITANMARRQYNIRHLDVIGKLAWEHGEGESSWD